MKEMNNMNMKSIIRAFSLLLMMTPLMTACNDDDDNGDGPIIIIDPVEVPTAVVTVVPELHGHPWLVLNDSTWLYPENISTPPFGEKEVRALVSYTPAKGDFLSGTPSIDKNKVNVSWLDSIRTKDMALPQSTNEAADATYGNDPIEVVNDWLTVSEDGYLTLRFRTRWGSGDIAHTLNLVTIGDGGNYTVRLCHNANGDTGQTVGDALIAFRLDQLPDTENKYVDLTLTWNSFSGPKQTTFKFCTRQAMDGRAVLVRTPYNERTQ